MLFIIETCVPNFNYNRSRASHITIIGKLKMIFIQAERGIYLMAAYLLRMKVREGSEILHSPVEESRSLFGCIFEQGKRFGA